MEDKESVWETCVKTLAILMSNRKHHATEFISSCTLFSHDQISVQLNSILRLTVSSDSVFKSSFRLNDEKLLTDISSSSFISLETGSHFCVHCIVGYSSKYTLYCTFGTGWSFFFLNIQYCAKILGH